MPVEGALSPSNSVLKPTAKPSEARLERDGTLAHKARASLRILFYDCRISSLKCSSSSFDTR